MAETCQAADITFFYHISGAENPSDIATKSVPLPIFHKHIGVLMIKAKGDKISTDTDSDDREEL